MSEHPHAPTTEHPDAVVVGAGFAGLYMLHRLREIGLRTTVLEAGGGIGGTWFWNRYPGARCDIESLDYSYSFSPDLEQEWDWSERYPSQPEILRYLEHVADRFDLRRDIQLDTRVVAATFDETDNRWSVRTDRDERFRPQFLVMATGCLSTTKNPEIPGLAEFRGRALHTGNWPHEHVDFTGQRVGVVGTGSSGIQIVPELADRAEELVVFQRTASYSMPARNGPIPQDVRDHVKANYRQRRHDARYTNAGIPYRDNELSEVSALEVGPEQRWAEYESRWNTGGLALLGAFSDTLTDRDANDTVAEFLRGKIHEEVDDPDTAELLTPRTHPFGARRPCVDNGYFRTFNRQHVTLVDVASAPIERITPNGMRTRDREYELDSIVLATGFDAMTGAVLNIDVRGRGGRPLPEKWSDGPRTYLGLATEGFPNLFLITGPGSPSVLSNMIVSIEQHVEWIAGALDYLRRHELASIEPEKRAEDDWVEHVNEVADGTLFPQADTWYTGSNVTGKTRMFMPYIGGVGLYRETCDEVAANGYSGFALTR